MLSPNCTAVIFSGDNQENASVDITVRNGVRRKKVEYKLQTGSRDLTKEATTSMGLGIKGMRAQMRRGKSKWLRGWQRYA